MSEERFPSGALRQVRPFLVFLSLLPRSQAEIPSPAVDCQADTRDAIHRLAREEPGLAVGDMSRRLGLTISTVSYHLTRLATEGVIATVVKGRRRLVFSAQTEVDRLYAEAAAILRGATALRTATTVRNHPGISITELIERVGESPRAVYYHVKILSEARLVASASPRRYRQLRPTAMLEALLDDRP